MKFKKGCRLSAQQDGRGEPVIGESAEGSTVPSKRTLWRDRDFVRLLIGQTSSHFGTQISLVAVPLVAVVSLGFSTDQVGVMRALGQVPYLLFALFVGVLVDRWRRRNLLVSADLGRALILAAIPVAFALGQLSAPVLYVIMFLVGICTVFFDVGYQALLPRLVTREQLVQGNSYLESSRSAALIGGPALGGAVVALLSAPNALTASIVFFLFSALMIWGIRVNEPPSDPAQRGKAPFRQIGEGLSLVARNPLLRSVVVISGLFNFLYAGYMTIYLVYLPSELGLSAVSIGLVFAALGPGLLVGAMVSSVLPQRIGYGWALVICSFSSCALLLGVPALQGSGVFTVGALIAINFLYACFSQTFTVSLMSIRQAMTPDQLQGRAAATLRFLGVGLVPVGSLCGGFLGVLVGTRIGLLMIVIAMCLAPFAFVFSSLARVGRSLDPAESS